MENDLEELKGKPLKVMSIRYTLWIMFIDFVLLVHFMTICLLLYKDNNKLKDDIECDFILMICSIATFGINYFYCSCFDKFTGRNTIIRFITITIRFIMISLFLSIPQFFLSLCALFCDAKGSGSSKYSLLFFYFPWIIVNLLYVVICYLFYLWKKKLFTSHAKAKQCWVFHGSYLIFFTLFSRIGILGYMGILCLCKWSKEMISHVF